MTRHSAHDTHTAIAIRPATTADRPALERLAGLDSARVPSGAVLVAEVAGRPQAALALESGAAVADPFAPTVHLVEMLRLQAAGLSAPARRSRERRFGVAALRAVRA